MGGKYSVVKDLSKEEPYVERKKRRLVLDDNQDGKAWHIARYLCQCGDPHFTGDPYEKEKPYQHRSSIPIHNCRLCAAAVAFKTDAPLLKSNDKPEDMNDEEVFDFIQPTTSEDIRQTSVLVKPSEYTEEKSDLSATLETFPRTSGQNEEDNQPIKIYPDLSEMQTEYSVFPPLCITVNVQSEQLNESPHNIVNKSPEHTLPTAATPHKTSNNMSDEQKPVRKRIPYIPAQGSDDDEHLEEGFLFADVPVQQIIPEQLTNYSTTKLLEEVSRKLENEHQASTLIESPPNVFTPLNRIDNRVDEMPQQSYGYDKLKAEIILPNELEIEEEEDNNTPEKSENQKITIQEKPPISPLHTQHVESDKPSQPNNTQPQNENKEIPKLVNPPTELVKEVPENEEEVPVEEECPITFPVAFQPDESKLPIQPDDDEEDALEEPEQIKVPVVEDLTPVVDIPVVLQPQREPDDDEERRTPVEVASPVSPLVVPPIVSQQPKDVEEQPRELVEEVLENEEELPEADSTPVVDIPVVLEPPREPDDDEERRTPIEVASPVSPLVVPPIVSQQPKDVEEQPRELVEEVPQNEEEVPVEEECPITFPVAFQPDESKLPIQPDDDEEDALEEPEQIKVPVVEDLTPVVDIPVVLEPPRKPDDDEERRTPIEVASPVSPLVVPPIVSQQPKDVEEQPRELVEEVPQNEEEVPVEEECPITFPVAFQPDESKLPIQPDDDEEDALEEPEQIKVPVVEDLTPVVDIPVVLEPPRKPDDDEERRTPIEVASPVSPLVVPPIVSQQPKDVEEQPRELVEEVPQNEEEVPVEEECPITFPVAFQPDESKLPIQPDDDEEDALEEPEQIKVPVVEDLTPVVDIPVVLEPPRKPDDDEERRTPIEVASPVSPLVVPPIVSQQPKDVEEQPRELVEEVPQNEEEVPVEEECPITFPVAFQPDESKLPIQPDDDEEDALEEPEQIKVPVVEDLTPVVDIPVVLEPPRKPDDDEERRTPIEVASPVSPLVVPPIVSQQPKDVEEQPRELVEEVPQNEEEVPVEEECPITFPVAFQPDESKLPIQPDDDEEDALEEPEQIKVPVVENLTPVVDIPVVLEPPRKPDDDEERRTPIEVASPVSPLVVPPIVSQQPKDVEEQPRELVEEVPQNEEEVPVEEECPITFPVAFQPDESKLPIQPDDDEEDALEEPEQIKVPVVEDLTPVVDIPVVLEPPRKPDDDEERRTPIELASPVSPLVVPPIVSQQPKDVEEQPRELVEEVPQNEEEVPVEEECPITFPVAFQPDESKLPIQPDDDEEDALEEPEQIKVPVVEDLTPVVDIPVVLEPPRKPDDDEERRTPIEVASPVSPLVVPPIVSQQPKDVEEQPRELVEEVPQNEEEVPVEEECPITFPVAFQPDESKLPIQPDDDEEDALEEPEQIKVPVVEDLTPVVDIPVVLEPPRKPDDDEERRTPIEVASPVSPLVVPPIVSQQPKDVEEQPRELVEEVPQNEEEVPVEEECPITFPVAFQPDESKLPIQPDDDEEDALEEPEQIKVPVVEDLTPVVDIPVVLEPPRKPDDDEERRTPIEVASPVSPLVVPPIVSQQPKDVEEQPRELVEEVPQNEEEVPVEEECPITFPVAFQPDESKLPIQPDDDEEDALEEPEQIKVPVVEDLTPVVDIPVVLEPPRKPDDDEERRTPIEVASPVSPLVVPPIVSQQPKDVEEQPRELVEEVPQNEEEVPVEEECPITFPVAFQPDESKLPIQPDDDEEDALEEPEQIKVPVVENLTPVVDIPVVLEPPRKPDDDEERRTPIEVASPVSPLVVPPIVSQQPKDVEEQPRELVEEVPQNEEEVPVEEECPITFPVAFQPDESKLPIQPDDDEEDALEEPEQKKVPVVEDLTPVGDIPVVLEPPRKPDDDEERRTPIEVASPVSPLVVPPIVSQQPKDVEEQPRELVEEVPQNEEEVPVEEECPITFPVAFQPDESKLPIQPDDDEEDALEEPEQIKVPVVEDLTPVVDIPVVLEPPRKPDDDEERRTPIEVASPVSPLVVPPIVSQQPKDVEEQPRELVEEVPQNEEEVLVEEECPITFPVAFQPDESKLPIQPDDDEEDALEEPEQIKVPVVEDLTPVVDIPVVLEPPRKPDDDEERRTPIEVASPVSPLVVPPIVSQQPKDVEEQPRELVEEVPQNEEEVPVEEECPITFPVAFQPDESKLPIQPDDDEEDTLEKPEQIKVPVVEDLTPVVDIPVVLEQPRKPDDDEERRTPIEVASPVSPLVVPPIVSQQPKDVEEQPRELVEEVPQNEEEVPVEEECPITFPVAFQPDEAKLPIQPDDDEEDALEEPEQIKVPVVEDLTPVVDIPVVLEQPRKPDDDEERRTPIEVASPVSPLVVPPIVSQQPKDVEEQPRELVEEVPQNEEEVPFEEECPITFPVAFQPDESKLPIQPDDDEEDALEEPEQIKVPVVEDLTPVVDIPVVLEPPRKPDDDEERRTPIEVASPVSPLVVPPIVSQQPKDVEEQPRELVEEVPQNEEEVPVEEECPITFPVAFQPDESKLPIQPDDDEEDALEEPEQIKVPVVEDLTPVADIPVVLEQPIEPEDDEGRRNSIELALPVSPVVDIPIVLEHPREPDDWEKEDPEERNIPIVIESVSLAKLSNDEGRCKIGEFKSEFSDLDERMHSIVEKVPRKTLALFENPSVSFPEGGSHGNKSLSKSTNALGISIDDDSVELGPISESEGHDNNNDDDDTTLSDRSDSDTIFIEVEFTPTERNLEDDLDENDSETEI